MNWYKYVQPMFELLRVFGGEWCSVWYVKRREEDEGEVGEEKKVVVMMVVGSTFCLSGLMTPPS